MRNVRLGSLFIYFLCGALAPVSTAWPSSPFLENGGFETPAVREETKEGMCPDAWFHFSIPSDAKHFGLTTRHAHSGRQSLFFKAQEETNAYQAAPQRIPVEPGAEYDFSIYVLNDRDDPIASNALGQISLEWKDANDVEIDRLWGPAWNHTLSTNRWQRFTVRGKAPQKALSCMLAVTFFSRDARARGGFFVDDASFTRRVLTKQAQSGVAPTAPGLQNAGFEDPPCSPGVEESTEPDSWLSFCVPDFAQATVSRAESRSDLQSARLLATTGAVEFLGMAQRVLVQSGGEYDFSIRVLNSDVQSLEGASYGQISLEWKAADGTEISRTRGPMWDPSLPLGEWREFTVSGTAPTNAANAVAVVTLIPNGQPGGFFVDDARFAPAGAGGLQEKRVIAFNRSTPTVCAEHDNVNIPLMGTVTSFVIEATHPTYDVDSYDCGTDFTGCPTPVNRYRFQPGTFKLFDDNTTVFEAVRESKWRCPYGMTAYAENGPLVTNVHYIRMYRKIADDVKEWPQFLVMYMDANIRLVPFPPEGHPSVCFGSSVLIGPVAVAPQPIAEIKLVRFLATPPSLRVIYSDGSSALITLEEINRRLARLRVDVDYPTAVGPFATFTSMFVEDGNCDADRVGWLDYDGVYNGGIPIMEFKSGEGPEWFFHRSARSRHNTSGPDIRIRIPGGSPASPPPAVTPVSADSGNPAAAP